MYGAPASPTDRVSPSSGQDVAGKVGVPERRRTARGDVRRRSAPELLHDRAVGVDRVAGFRALDLGPRGVACVVGRNNAVVVTDELRRESRRSRALLATGARRAASVADAAASSLAPRSCRARAPEGAFGGLGAFGRNPGGRASPNVLRLFGRGSRLGLLLPAPEQLADPVHKAHAASLCLWGCAKSVHAAVLVHESAEAVAACDAGCG